MMMKMNHYRLRIQMSIQFSRWTIPFASRGPARRMDESSHHQRKFEPAFLKFDQAKGNE
jgi:hypothetical protein